MPLSSFFSTTAGVILVQPKSHMSLLSWRSCTGFFHQPHHKTVRSHQVCEAPLHLSDLISHHFPPGLHCSSHTSHSLFLFQSTESVPTSGPPEWPYPLSVWLFPSLITVLKYHLSQRNLPQPTNIKSHPPVKLYLYSIFHYNPYHLT